MITLRFKQLYFFAFIALIFSLSTAAAAQTRSYRVSDRQVETLLNRIEARTNDFRLAVNREFYKVNDFKPEEEINSYVADFENATDALKSNFAERDSTTGDVQEVLNRAAYINGFMRDNRVAKATQTQWKLIRADLNTLAGYYRVSWNRNNSQITNYPVVSFDSRLTGSYRLNTAESDNVSTTIDKAISKIRYTANQRERTRNNLVSRLTSPDTLMIEKRGQEVTLSSSTSAQVTFNADGVSRSETSDNGRTMQVRAASTESDLTLNYEGDRMNDYYVSFTPTSSGQLRISRRVYLENRNETVTVTSVYDKTDRGVRWATTNYPNKVNGNNGNDFVIPNDTAMTATLDTPLSTKTSKNDDKFTMTVTSPAQYQGAVIEGRVVGEKSGILTGRASLSFNFETIRLRNGIGYRFAGIVEQVREPNGSDIKVNNEGTIRDGNQTTKTATRAGIGAVIGAIVGTVAGGGKGAAVGAAIGGVAGAGTVILQGRDNLEIPSGSEFTITATAPGNIANNR